MRTGFLNSWLCAAETKHDAKVDEAALHRDRGNIRREHLVGPVHIGVAQQAWVDRMSRIPLAGVGLFAQRFDTQLEFTKLPLF